jgi:hypothetical protein
MLATAATVAGATPAPAVTVGAGTLAAAATVDAVTVSSAATVAPGTVATAATVDAETVASGEPPAGWLNSSSSDTEVSRLPLSGQPQPSADMFRALAGPNQPTSVTAMSSNQRSATDAVDDKFPR